MTAVALVPMATVFGPGCPLPCSPVLLPRWYTTVAPNLPPGQVLLSYPAPFSGIQVAMAWQAVNAMHYSQAGGGGPQGQASAPAARRPASTCWPTSAFGIVVPPPAGTPAQYAAVRHALSLAGDHRRGRHQPRRSRRSSRATTPPTPPPS